jgi:hypothetical protein
MKILAVAAAVLLVLSGCSVLAPADDDDVFSIVVGDCLDDAGVPDEVTTLPIVDCTEPHASEVFAGTSATEDVFPGGDVLQAALVEFCRGDAFTEFVGIPFADSRYATRGYFPTAESWANGDRELLCTLVDESGAELTGSLAGVDE